MNPEGEKGKAVGRGDLQKRKDCLLAFNVGETDVCIRKIVRYFV